MNRFVICLILLGIIISCKPIFPKSSVKYGDTINSLRHELREGMNNNLQLRKADPIPVAVQKSLLYDQDSYNLKNNFSIQMPQEKFDIVADAVAAREFFLGLVDGTNLNLIVDPNVQGNISLKLKNATLQEALDTVKQVYGFDYEVIKDGFHVLPATLQTKIFHVNYLNMQRDGSSEMQVGASGLMNAESGNEGINSKITSNVSSNFWDELTDAINVLVGEGDGRKVAISPMAGTVLVQAFPGEIAKVAKFLQQSSNNLNRKIILEAKIMEVELNDGYRAGISWGLISRRLKIDQRGSDLHGGSSFATDIPNNVPVADGSDFTVDLKKSSDQRAIVDIPSIVTPYGGILSLGTNLGKLATLMELLSSQGNVQVLSNPRVSTTNQQKALIKVGTDEYFVTKVTNNVVTTATSTVNQPSADFKPFFSGIALDVTPQIGDNDIITLHVHPTISTVSQSDKEVTVTGNTQKYQLAKTTIRESDSVVQAYNGEIVVLGGLMQDKTREVVTGVPGLKDLPILGKMFRHTRQDSVKSELVIVIRPIIVDQHNMVSEIENIYNNIDKLDRSFH